MMPQSSQINAALQEDWPGVVQDRVIQAALPGDGQRTQVCPQHRPQPAGLHQRHQRHLLTGRSLPLVPPHAHHDTAGLC